MRRLLLCTISLLVVSSWSLSLGLAQDGAQSQPNTLTPQEIADGWLLLFDGESSFGWRSNGPILSSRSRWKNRWYIEDGALRLDFAPDPVDRARGRVWDMLYTTSQFANYELKMDFHSTTEDVETCLRLRTSPSPRGELDKNARQQAIYVYLEPEVRDDAWHSLHLTLDGGHLLVRIDDEVVRDTKSLPALGRGYIGLYPTPLPEHSSLYQPKIAFRNIKLRPLGMTSLFNGKDLTGWNTFPELPTKVSVTDDGAMLIENGSGMVETAEAYDDFTFQTDVFVGATGLNSGVFYRCIPGDKMNGYEAQINNNMVDGNPDRPADCGTGGIFRRQNARRIVAKDLEWFTMTIHADDKHVATWVDGYPVCDWSDNREPDPNPRRGLRLEPGTIQFQGHDPTTRVLFRNIRISEIPER